MDIINSLKDIGLDSTNSVVIGSGILNALQIRNCNDIDVVVGVETYQTMRKDARFVKALNHGLEVLSDGLFEIGTSWNVLGRSRSFDDLRNNSVVIDGVCYVTLDFLLAIKESWLNDDGVRQKDIDDIKLIKDYQDRQS